MTGNRYWRLDRHPEGNTHFDRALTLCVEEPVALQPGEVRIAVDWLSMDAGTRMWMSPRTDGYQPPLPLGSKMVGLVLGRVSESSDPAFPVGAMVRGFGQWAEQAVVVPALAGLEVVDEAVSDPRQHFGALGMNSWTAYVGVKEVAAVKAGEWLAVSAAAGATGSLACQIGRNLGARVVGIAGGPDKCRFLTEEIGVDIAIDYRNEDVEARLATIEGGISAFFDNVGGPILDAVLPNMAHYGRVAICGMVAGYDADAPMPGPARFDQILMRRLRVEGFFIPDFLERGAKFMPRLREWLDAGKLTMRFDETKGIGNVLAAYERMLTGRNIGKVIVRL
ncbi:NADP-dependent oxidoreductase [Novosphingobium mangrovi (ex Huang et al. 2023)]|uniref:NADP-dependent oxidoreductase n=1 Tax=Novosphingobium mangrovi (ex Huang et al. 2023) TaxID=2976432 RepID=A0ABT2IA64_9SPHN|nr:NADP-dependent oxidoreductase [Novosphingobium mangrovi (ex Huang et al. 2023)]MCT2401720.1 NADP-dependent oxidoreductase [Novosphingobium mangrovi (ex Huang et al. 2023)]